MDLLENLETKVTQLITELHALRKQVSDLQQQNHILKTEQIQHGQRLQGIVSLLEQLPTANDLDQSDKETLF
jgi:regulator of replication initiation timing